MKIGLCYDLRDEYLAMGYSEEYHMARYFRDARLLSIGAGADEVKRFRVSLRTDQIYTDEKLHHYGLMKAEHYALGGYGAVEAFHSAGLRLLRESGGWVARKVDDLAKLD